MACRKLLLGVCTLIILVTIGTPCLALTDIEFVTVWDPGNPANYVPKKGDGSTGYGSVDQIFNIGKYETTNLQYVDFLNAVAVGSDPNSLYHTSMGTTVWGGITRSGTLGSYVYSVRPHMGNKPVNFVSAYDASRFANWLHNGQPVGAQDASTTEDGAYTFSGFETISDRNPGAKFFIPTEHEWEKSAFYQPGVAGSIGNGWWGYVSRTKVFPTLSTVDAFGNVTNPSNNTVNFQQLSNWNGTIDGNVTTVGSAGQQSFFGAYDMSGNVFEWTVADPTKPDPNGWGPYTVRGGSFTNAGHVFVEERNMVHHDNHGVVRQDVGFRMAAAYEFDAADFNEDMVVDGDDLLVWQSNFGAGSDGDANGDGFTDGSDFLVWQRNLPTTAVTAIPEPGALLLSSVMMLFAGRRRHRTSGKQ